MQARKTSSLRATVARVQACQVRKDSLGKQSGTLTPMLQHASYSSHSEVNGTADALEDACDICSREEDSSHLKVLAVDALAVVGAVDGGLEALAVLLQAAALLAVAALVVARRRARRQRCSAVLAALQHQSQLVSGCPA